MKRAVAGRWKWTLALLFGAFQMPPCRIRFLDHRQRMYPSRMRSTTPPTLPPMMAPLRATTALVGRRDGDSVGVTLMEDDDVGIAAVVLADAGTDDTEMELEVVGGELEMVGGALEVVGRAPTVTKNQLSSRGA